jgi:hypothetical protein
MLVLAVHSLQTYISNLHILGRQVFIGNGHVFLHIHNLFCMVFNKPHLAESIILL